MNSLSIDSKCYFFQSFVEYDGWLNIRLQHSFGSNQFTDRGNITLQSIRSGTYIIDQNPLTSTELNTLKVNVQITLYKSYSIFISLQYNFRKWPCPMDFTN